MTSLENLYDKELNIETIYKEKDSTNTETMFNSYEPTSYYFLEKLFRAFPFEEKDHLIDFGCGKGRVLFMAAISGCKHVTGYEVNMERYDILKRNVEMYQKRFGEKTTFDIYLQDAQRAEISETANKFFFFNPFHLIVHARTINKILASLKKNKRNLEIYLYRPHESIMKYHESITDFHRELLVKYSFATKNVVREETPQIVIYSNYEMENVEDAYSMFF